MIFRRFCVTTREKGETNTVVRKFWTRRHALQWFAQNLRVARLYEWHHGHWEEAKM
jgi:hypothetical protein